MSNHATNSFRKLRNRFLREERRWRKNMLQEKQDKLASNRYEGISTGFRWAAQELKEYCDR